MPSDALTPIPTPPAQRWRDFRVQGIPVVVFVLAILCVTRIWQRELVAPSATGQVEAIQTQVTSPQPGRLATLSVSRFQRVTKGQVIASVIPTDPRLELSSIDAQIALIRARLEPLSGQQRDIVNHEKLLLDVLLERAKLSASRVRVELAKDDTRRAEQLFQGKLISEAEYDLRRKELERLQVEVQETAKALDLAQSGLEKLNQISQNSQHEQELASSSALLNGLEKRLATCVSNTVSVTIEAPISGTVSFVFRQPGEQLRDGDPIVTLSSETSDRVISYIQTPFSQEPHLGMEVEIRSRSGHHESGVGKVLHVGSQIESIPPALAGTRVSNTSVQLGLPFAVSLPPSLKVRPGELVDLVLRSAPPSH